MSRLVLSFSLALMSHLYLLQFDFSYVNPTPPQLISDTAVTVTLNHNTAYQQVSSVQEVAEDEQPLKPPTAPARIVPRQLPTPSQSSALPQPKQVAKPQTISPQVHKHKKTITSNPNPLIETTPPPQTALPLPPPSKLAETSAYSSQPDPTPPAPNLTSSVIKARPLYQHNPKPEYPILARRRGWEGTVLLLVKVTEKGQVTSVKLQHSCGYTILDKAARKAVKNWRFLAGTSRGRSVASAILIPVHFKLHDP